MNPTEAPPATLSRFKSRPGLHRVWRAFAYSWAGLRAAVRHEAAFRQELAIGLPALVLAWLIAPGRWQGLAMSLAVLAVWVIELLNSALEALADALSTESHPLIKRAKDMGSAAVMLTLVAAVGVWAALLLP
jgi:diacylglycerol kinase (ATP)